MFLSRLLILLGLWLVAALPLSAQTIALYEGEVPVADQSEAARLAALPQALAQVLVKLTGDPLVADDPTLAAELPRAPGLLQQFRYRSGDAGGTARLLLVASFQSGAVDALLAAAGRRAWPLPRPEPVVWLAIDDGRGARLLGASQAQAVAALTGQAARRGLRLNYPLLDLDDQRQIDASRVWNFSFDAVTAATARYAAQTALVGKLYREGSGWAVEWRVLADGGVIDQRRAADAEAAPLLTLGADLAADALARRFASTIENSGPPGRYAIRVAPIGSAEDYARLIGYLRGLPIVRRVQPTDADDGSLRVELELSTGIDGFARLVDGRGVLRVLPDRGGDAREFQLEP